MKDGIKYLLLLVKLKDVVKVTDDGCGCKQPNKIKKENLATLIADWDSVETVF